MRKYWVSIVCLLSVFIIAFPTMCIGLLTSENNQENVIPEKRQFDFGTLSSPTESGYTQVSEITSYSYSTGFGWNDTDNLTSADRGLPDNLRRDLIQSTVDRTFLVDLQDGDYQVTLIIGDYGYMHDMIDVYAEDLIVVDNLTLDKDTFYRTILTVTVADGQLNIRFHDNGGTDQNWVINAIITEPKPNDMSLELVISRRMSIHYGLYFSNDTIPWEMIYKVLWAAYGYSWRGRTVPSLCTYPLIIYVCDNKAAYRYHPENQSLTIWKYGDYRRVAGGNIAPIKLYIVVDINLCNDVNLGNAEAGCVVQSIHLIANALNLGTCCEGGDGVNRTQIEQKLGLPENEKVLYQMPLGYPLPPCNDYENLVPASRPSSPELPEIQDSDMDLENALESVHSSHDWSENPVTQQELSQILWAAYGYSYLEDTSRSPPKRHRTVPSAHSYYPMRIYAADSSGVYEYQPQEHNLTIIATEDRRQVIALASGNAWASSAPLIIATVWDEDRILQPPADYDYLKWVNMTIVEVGLINQNVYLESAAWGLIADWNTTYTNEEAVRQALGLNGQTNLHPASIITVGHPSKYLQKITWDDKSYYVETKTNSTILNFAFDQPNKKVTFNVSGSSGTIGFCNISIPNTLLWGAINVEIDDEPPASLVRIDNASHAILYFTYELLSTRNVEIIGEYVVPEFGKWQPLIIILFASAFVIVILRNKRKIKVWYGAGRIESWKTNR